jgi:glycosyltransferase involved in cell wall biosynthesis
VAAQTYSNIEICFSDNASTDDSWKVALEFSQQYSGKMNLTRNRMNFGASSNLENCWLNTRGKYMLMLCTDDAMRPDFIERCVSLLEKHPGAAFAMVHRDVLDENNRITNEPPFYDQTCLIPGDEQAAVYMMAAVNPSVSQILYNYEKMNGKSVSGVLNDRWFGARFIDFTLCCEYSMIYIKEPLLLNRVHSCSDGASIDNNLIQCVGQYVLAHQFAEIAKNAGLKKASGRLSVAVEKVGKLCIRYCVRSLLSKDEITALRYFHLAPAIFPGVVEDATFQHLNNYWHQSSAKLRKDIISSLESQINSTVRSESYSPPPGSIAC